MLAERDIDNACCELPREGVFLATEEAAWLVHKHHGMRNECVAVSICSIDLTRRPAGFRVVMLDEVLKCVSWDLDCNTFFECNGWFLNQNIKGVLIGGFLSTRLKLPLRTWSLFSEKC